MKIVLIMLFLLLPQIVSASQNTPEVIKNSEEISTILVSMQDQAVLSVCQQYPLELIFLNDDGSANPISNIKMDREVHNAITADFNNSVQSSFILKSAISKETYQKAISSNVDLSETLRVKTAKNENILIKLKLVSCLPDLARVKVVNIKTQSALDKEQKTADGKLVERFVDRINKETANNY